MACLCALNFTCDQMASMPEVSSPSSSAQGSEAADPAGCKTIREAINLFMSEKEAKLKRKTYNKYDKVMSLFITSMNSYGWNSVSDEYDSSVEFVDKYEPSLIADCVSEFLSYFMVRKVLASKEILKSSGTVTNQLLKWLWKHKYIEEEHHKGLSTMAREATSKLPLAEELSGALYELAEEPLEGEIEESYTMDGYWIIKTVLPSGWVVKPFMGCARDDLEITLPLPPFIAEQGIEGWQVCMGLAKVNGTWRIMPMTVGNVYPF